MTEKTDIHNTQSPEQKEANAFFLQAALFPNPSQFKNESRVGETDPYYRSVFSIVTWLSTGQIWKVQIHRTGYGYLFWFIWEAQSSTPHPLTFSHCILQCRDTEETARTQHFAASSPDAPQGWDQRQEPYLPRKHLGKVVSLRFRSLMRWPLVMRW